MRLRDVAGAIDERGIAGSRKQRRFGPEVHRVADRQFQFIGNIAGGQPALLGPRGIAGRKRGTAESLGEFHRLRLDQSLETLQQLIGVHRRQRAKAKAYFSRRRDHVCLDAAFDAPEVEAQPGEATKALMRLRCHEVQCGISPTHGLVQRAVTRLLLARGMPGVTGKAHQHRLDAAMCQHGFCLGRLSDDHGFIIIRYAEEAGDATRIVCFFVGGQQQGQRTVGGTCHCQQRRCRALDIAGTETDCVIRGNSKFVWARAPVRRVRHRIHMHVEQVARLAAHRMQGHCAGAVVGYLHIESGQLRAHVVEHPTGADRTRRVTRVECDQRLEMRQRGIEQRAHPRLTSAHSVLLMPNSLMKPSASSTPQSADCA